MYIARKCALDLVGFVCHKAVRYYDSLHNSHSIHLHPVSRTLA